MDAPAPAPIAVLDPHHGIGGTYVVLADGARVPTDPITGLPLPPPEQQLVEVPAEAPADAVSVQVAKSRRKNLQE